MQTTMLHTPLGSYQCAPVFRGSLASVHRATQSALSRQRKARWTCSDRSAAAQAILQHNGDCGADDPIQHLSKTQYLDANFPMDPEGRTYHLGTKAGQVAPRILSVGSVKRAMLLSQYLDPPDDGDILLEIESDRGFLTITGKFKGTPVSIVSTMMGMANMDFVIRECQAVVEGSMAMIRLGTCGAIQPPALLGSFLVASQGSVCIRRDPDAFAPGSKREPYSFTKPIAPDKRLSRLLFEQCCKAVGPKKAQQGLNATADSFYSSQGRLSASFDDRNDELLSLLVTKHPTVLSLEMETFHLFDLARCSGGRIKAAAMAIALAERYTNDFIAADEIEQLEKKAGVAALTALCQFRLAEQSQLGSNGTAGTGARTLTADSTH